MENLIGASKKYFNSVSEGRTSNKKKLWLTTTPNKDFHIYKLNGVKV